MWSNSKRDVLLWKMDAKPFHFKKNYWFDIFIQIQIVSWEEEETQYHLNFLLQTICKISQALIWIN